MKKMEKKIILRSTTISNTDNRIITGCAVVFDSWSRDLGGFTEIIHKGAITQDLINNSDIIMNINHDDDKMVARFCKGKGTLSLELKEDGLYFSFEAPDTALGNELLYNIRNGNLFECSFAFTISDLEGAERWYYDNDNNPKREINLIDGLYDCSIVTHAAYGDTSCCVRGLSVETINVNDKINETSIKITSKYDSMIDKVKEFLI